MNWEAMGAIGEIVSAVGVIATLGYLALQVRQNSNVTRSATRQAISSVQADLGLRMAESPDLRAAALLCESLKINTTNTKTAPSMPRCGSAIARTGYRLFRKLKVGSTGNYVERCTVWTL
jgi:hypothetical protein